MAVEAMDIAHAVKAARVLRGLSATEIAGALGCTEWRIWRIERGQSEPTFREIALLAKRTRLSLKFFEDQGA